MNKKLMKQLKEEMEMDIRFMLFSVCNLVLACIIKCWYLILIHSILTAIFIYILYLEFKRYHWLISIKDELCVIDKLIKESRRNDLDIMCSKSVAAGVCPMVCEKSINKRNWAFAFGKKKNKKKRKKKGE